MALMVRTCPSDWSLRRVAFVAVLLGVMGRVGFLWFPVGNDVYRYIWEGYIQNHGFNPYQVAPNDPSLARLIQGDMALIWQQINHKDLSAAYPPLMMILFRTLSAISPSPILFKVVMMGFDLMTLGALVLIVQSQKIKPAYLLWYVANPLVLVYVAGEAHLDIVQAAFLVWALYFIDRRNPVAGFLALGMSAPGQRLFWPEFFSFPMPMICQRCFSLFSYSGAGCITMTVWRNSCAFFLGHWHCRCSP